MNIFQQALGTVFPPYKRKVRREEQNELFKAIISSLPFEYKELREQAIACRFFGLENWKGNPDFKFVTLSYPGETYSVYKKRGQNFKISGLKIFSKITGRFEDVQILVGNNLIHGLKIENSNYQLKEFDLNRINVEGIQKTPFAFPPDDTDIFYDFLGQDIKNILGPDDIFDIDFNNRTFYAFYDLEDGNFLAVDKNLKVYSLVHDARPMAKGMKTSFIEILNKISNNQFDKEKHLEERYRDSK
ncbi:MAG TPA: hypothetical protein VIM89_23145 [Mucilaginibacter sp.]